MIHEHFKQYYREMHNLMRELGEAVVSSPTLINRIEHKVKAMGDPPCPVCGEELLINTKYVEGKRVICTGCERRTGLYYSKVSALRAIKQWVQPQEAKKRQAHEPHP